MQFVNYIFMIFIMYTIYNTKTKKETIQLDNLSFHPGSDLLSHKKNMQYHQR